MKPLRANDEIDRRRFQKLRATTLRHATHVTENQAGFSFLFCMRQAIHLTNRPLLREITNAASIQQYNIRVGFRGRNAVTPFAQQRRDRLTVAHIHLAAVSFDENFFHHAGCRP